MAASRDVRSLHAAMQRVTDLVHRIRASGTGRCPACPEEPGWIFVFRKGVRVAQECPVCKCWGSLELVNTAEEIPS